MQLPLAHISGQENVHRLALTNEWGAVRSVLDHPMLVDLKRSAENSPFLIRQEVEMLNTPLADRDVAPGVCVVAAVPGQNVLQVRVADREVPREGLLEENVGRDRFDPRGCAPGYD